jgi:uncharacterized protein YhdP
VSATVPGQADLDVRYGSTLQLLAGLGGEPRSPRLERGSLLLGPGQPDPAVAPGLVVQGRIPVLDLDGWRGLLAANPVGAPTWVRRVDVKVDELQVGGRAIRQLALEAGADSWLLEVRDPELPGTVRGSIPLRAGPVEARFRRLNMDFGGSGEEESSDSPLTSQLDPRQLPPLRLRVEELYLDGSPAGSLVLETNPLPEGLELSRLELVGKQFELNAEGHWTGAESGARRAAVQARLQSEDVGKALRELGLYADIDGADGKLQLNVHWPGPLTEPDLSTLAGGMRIDLGAGRFVEIDTGAGRLMGLFNLRGLVRHLRLDFSDLFEKGFSFDSITADIAFADGNATTDDLVINGPVARVDVSGRVGLVARDYDQQVVVTPAVGGSLPLAGFLAGGPVGGAAGFLAGKVFERQIGRAAQVRYRITGSWDDPVVEKLPAQQFVFPEEWADQPDDR